MSKKLTRTGVKMKLNKEFDTDIGQELQAIGTLLRVMNKNELRIPLSSVNKVTDTTIVRQLLILATDIFNTSHSMGKFLEDELQVSVDLGIAINDSDVVLALGDPKEGSTSTIFWEDV